VALSAKHLVHIEQVVRVRADRCRKEAEAYSDSAAAEVQAHAANMRAEADALDIAANIVIAAAHGWGNLREPLLGNYAALTAEHERIKAAAAAAKAEDVAA
jgi:hypothetical protein